MLRIEAYSMMDGLMLHVAASNLRDPSQLGGGNGMSVHRVVPVENIEAYGIEDCITEELMGIFRLYRGLAHYALR